MSAAQPIVAAPVATDAQSVPNAAAPTAPEGFKVYAGNLKYSVKDESLKAFFAPIAEHIVAVTVAQRGGNRSAGYGFVDVKTLEAAQKAVELLDGKDLEGRPVSVQIAKPREEKENTKDQAAPKTKKRVSKKLKDAATAAVDAIVPSETADKNAESTDADGAAKSKNRRNQRNKKKVKAATEGETVAPAADAAEPTEKKAKKPKAPKVAKVPRPAGEAPPGELSKTTLFVANLGFNVDDAGLSKLFTDANIAVTSARVVRRRWGSPRRSKGYGFVNVGSEENQKKALETLQGKKIDEREIAVKIAVDSQVADAEKAEAEAVSAAPATTTV